MFIRKGSMLIEILFVVTVISVLISLLLPAIQVAREAAKQASYSNTLKQQDILPINLDQRGETLKID
tara:strand:- start:391 stop:591 length:201 start_codon:yes stop_codon:yes gene_type:complete